MKGVPLNEELYKYIADTFAEEDEILKEVVKETEEKNFPLIQISPENGKFLQILVRLVQAKRVLEVGTLTGYSGRRTGAYEKIRGRAIRLNIHRRRQGKLS